MWPNEGWQEDFYRRFEEARLRYLAVHDDLGALRTLVDGLPSRAQGLSDPARMMLAERLRDVADLVERGLL